jgi:hypothetical protein
MKNEANRWMADNPSFRVMVKYARPYYRIAMTARCAGVKFLPHEVRISNPATCSICFVLLQKYDIPDTLDRMKRELNEFITANNQVLWGKAKDMIRAANKLKK